MQVLPLVQVCRIQPTPGEVAVAGLRSTEHGAKGHQPGTGLTGEQQVLDATTS